MKYEARVWQPIYSAAQWAFRRVPVIRALVPSAPRAAIRTYLAVRAIGALPDRRYLEDQILPTLAGGAFRRLLFVGCRRYTRHYEKLFDRASTDYWTADLDP